jgi:putative phosphoesterase
MKLGLVSDIHCNAAALTRAIALMGEIDALLCLGDVIRQYRFCNETVAILKDHDAQVILGNHEAIFYGPHGERARAAPWIDPELMAWLGAQPHRRELRLAGREVLMVHSTPWPSGDAYVVPQTSEFRRFGETSADVVLYGHTHQPVAQRVKDTLVVNPGSTGEARLVDDRLELSCAVLDLTTGEVCQIAFPEPGRDASRTAACAPGLSRQIAQR